MSSTKEEVRRDKTILYQLREEQRRVRWLCGETTMAEWQIEIADTEGLSTTARPAILDQWSGDIYGQ
jgi:hypothetical protein